MALNLQALQGVVDQLHEDGVDLNEAKSGGSVEIAEGKARARVVGYIELGTEYNEKFKKIVGKAVLISELSGSKWPAREFDGKKEPLLIKEFITLPADFGQLSKKSTAYQLFKKLNWRGNAKHFAELVLQHADYLVDIKMEPGKTNPDRKYVSIRDEASGYRISPTKYEDPETSELKSLDVDKAITEPQVFLWNYADLEQWHSIFIEGSWDAQEEEKDASGKVIKEARPARSRNVWQERVLSSPSFKGSKIEALLSEQGIDFAAIAEATDKVEATGSAAADPLAG